LETCKWPQRLQECLKGGRIAYNGRSSKFTQLQSEPFELNETSFSSVYFWYTYLFVIRRNLMATAWIPRDFM